jgi:hypothetical protein
MLVIHAFCPADTRTSGFSCVRCSRVLGDVGIGSNVATGWNRRAISSIPSACKTIESKERNG